MNRLKRHTVFLDLVSDLFVEGSVGLISLEPGDMQRLVEAIRTYQLDFDDAYQYVLAQLHDVSLVSFDRDFDRTDRGCKSPREILATLTTGDSE